MFISIGNWKFIQRSFQLEIKHVLLEACLVHMDGLWVMLKIMKPTKSSTSGTLLSRAREAGSPKWVFIFHVSLPFCHTLASLFPT